MNNNNINQYKAKYSLNLVNYALILGWFGIRKDFCQFLLSTCPILQEYANIAYHSDNRSDREDGSKNERKMDKRLKKSEIMKPVVPIVSIEMPD